MEHTINMELKSPKKLYRLILFILLFGAFLLDSKSVLADNNTGVVIISGKSDPGDSILIELPNGNTLQVISNQSGLYMTHEIEGLAIGDTVHVVAIDSQGNRSAPTSRKITSRDIVSEESPNSTSKSATNNQNKSSSGSVKKKDHIVRNVVIGVVVLSSAVSSGLIINKRFPRVKKSIFTLVGTSILWNSQKAVHKVKIIGMLNEVTNLQSDKISEEERKKFASTGSVELKRLFTKFEIKIFNEQNENIRMVIIDG